MLKVKGPLKKNSLFLKFDINLCYQLVANSISKCSFCKKDFTKDNFAQFLSFMIFFFSFTDVEMFALQDTSHKLDREILTKLSSVNFLVLLKI